MHDFKRWVYLNSLILAFYGLYCTSWPLFKRSHSSGEGMPEGKLCHFLKGLLKATSVDGKMNKNFRDWFNGVICAIITLKTIFFGGKQKESGSLVWYNSILTLYFGIEVLFTSNKIYHFCHKCLQDLWDARIAISSFFFFTYKFSHGCVVPLTSISISLFFNFFLKTPESFLK